MAKVLGVKAANKMGAVRSFCNAKHFHASKGEAARCDDLHWWVRAELISELKIYPSIPLWKGRKYKADFSYYENSKGKLKFIVEDFKGAQSRDFQLVKKAWPHYGRGVLRETRRQGTWFTAVREIEGASPTPTKGKG